MNLVSPKLAIPFLALAFCLPSATGEDVSGPKSAPKKPAIFDLSADGTSAVPCVDFYQYACGNWRKNNPIPSDQTRWGRFNELADYNRQFLHNILEKHAANNPKRSP